MAVAKRKEWNAMGAPSTATELRLGGPAPSPARALQHLLDERTMAAPEIERWSHRRTLAFLVVTSCALWAAILEIASHAIRAIA